MLLKKKKLREIKSPCLVYSLICFLRSATASHCEALLSCSQGLAFCALLDRSCSWVYTRANSVSTLCIKVHYEGFSEDSFSENHLLSPILNTQVWYINDINKNFIILTQLLAFTDFFVTECLFEVLER